MQKLEAPPTSESLVSAPSQAASVSAHAPQSLAVTLAATLVAAWQPTSIPQPEVDPNLTELSGVERAAEVCRYKLLQLEYALSSGGGLRAWLKLNLLVCFLLGIPALFVVPVITLLLGSFATWTAFLFQIALNILYTLLTIVAIVGVAMALGYLLSTFRRR